MAERNGFSAFVKLWPVLAACILVGSGLLAWQLDPIRADVAQLKLEHRDAVPWAKQIPTVTARIDAIVQEQARRQTLVEEIPSMRENVKVLTQDLATRTTLVAVVDARLGMVERELQMIRQSIEDLRQHLRKQ